MSYNFKALQAVTYKWAEDSTNNGVIVQYVSPEFTFRDNLPSTNNIVMINKGVEMLRVAEDGFYIRGEKVPVDDREAITVYNAFKEFLVWSRLSRE
jgi:hypothetical protein